MKIQDTINLDQENFSKEEQNPFMSSLLKLLEIKPILENSKSTQHTTITFDRISDISSIQKN